MRESLAWHREEQDPKENRESTPPEDERVQWHGVYVAEAYGPSHVRQLLQSVERLGWNESRNTSDKTLGEWIRASRGSSSGPAYFVINLLSRDRRHGLPGPSGVFEAPLPQGVSHARGVVFAPTPGLTLVVLLFLFEDDLAGQVEGTLRREFHTRQERIEGGWRTLTAGLQKSEAVRAQREQLRAKGAELFRSHLPGAFASDLNREHPTCEVMTTARARPFEQPEERRSPGWLDYLRVLGLNRGHDAWHADDLPGFRLELPGGFSQSPALVLAGHARALAGIDSSYGSSERDRLSGYLHMRLDGLMALWASYEVLSGYHAVLGSARDLGVAQTGRATAALRRLSKVRDELLVGAADARTLAEELAAAAEDRRTFDWLLEVDFKAVEPEGWRDSSLKATLLASVKEEAASLQRTEARVRDDLVVDSGVLGAAGNLRLQRSVAWLTWILVVIGVLTVVLVAYQIWGL